MPAVAKKSSAYREGRADKNKPSIEIEINPEGEEEEGMEGEEMDAAKSHSRKRSAKGAKQTKAPMDGMYGKKPMDGEGCGCGGRKGKGKCDGNCGKKMDRADALTPQEYLAACELGIQGRSRSYIRARLDAAERLDKKCGASGIADNKKCHVGAAGSSATSKKSSKSSNTLGNIAALGVVGGAIGIAHHVETQKQKSMEAREVISKVKDLKYKANSGVTAAARAAASGVEFARTSRYYNEKPGQRAPAVERAIVQGMARVREAQATRSAVYGEARQALRELGESVPASPARRRRARAERKARRAPGGSVAIRDTYADGFSFETSTLAI